MAKRVTMVPVSPIDQCKSESASKSPLEQEQTSNSKDLEHQGDGEMIRVIELESMAAETIEMARESQDILGKENQHPEVNLKPQTVSLHSHATSVTVFNGLNFSEWREQVNFHLGVLDLDLALLEEKPAYITDESSDTEKLKRKAWDRSNKLCMSFMRLTITNNIKTTLPESVTAKEYLKLVEERFRSAYKSLAGTLMAELTTMKYDGSRSMQQHVLEMTNTAARLKSLVLTVDDSFLVQFILNSLPPEYGPFQINFNTIKDKWDVNELSSKLTQEETRLKAQGGHTVNLVGQGASKVLKPKFKKFKKKGPTKVPQLTNGKKEDKADNCHFFPSNTWWLDSGATTHVSNMMQGFLTIQSIDPSKNFLFMGNQMKAPIEDFVDAVESKSDGLSTGIGAGCCSGERSAIRDAGGAGNPSTGASARGNTGSAGSAIGVGTPPIDSTYSGSGGFSNEGLVVVEIGRFNALNRAKVFLCPPRSVIGVGTPPIDSTNSGSGDFSNEGLVAVEIGRLNALSGGW
ncbi:hypothetical protein BUALT_Bualt08G0057200 [Buddleja alternifolia]|uniref:Uncharacterized protein n=1 Tax=Buddleja alternifolia TaxID=168488 RepID=A0AAV6XCJ8_9LAMI|nr:hypothetical protein BUALT_Bualt08G0057200 [Buddleja alternifolia]